MCDTLIHIRAKAAQHGQHGVGLHSPRITVAARGSPRLVARRQPRHFPALWRSAAAPGAPHFRQGEPLTPNLILCENGGGSALRFLSADNYELLGILYQFRLMQRLVGLAPSPWEARPKRVEA